MTSKKFQSKKQEVFVFFFLSPFFSFFVFFMVIYFLLFLDELVRVKITLNNCKVAWPSHLQNGKIISPSGPLMISLIPDILRHIVLEFECHLDLQEDSSNNVCNKRMENEDTNWTKQTTQGMNKYYSGIYSIIHNNKSGVTIGYK